MTTFEIIRLIIDFIGVATIIYVIACYLMRRGDTWYDILNDEHADTKNARG
jgi:hypothetical protein